MKYYSEKCKRMYDSVEDLATAEKEFDDKAAKELALREERKVRAQEVTDKYKEYLELREKFIKDYGSWHVSLTEKDLPSLSSVKSVWDLFDNFWF